MTDRAGVLDADLVLSRKQEALWLFQRLAPDAAVDNLAFAVRTSAAIDLPRLADAVVELVRRHPALRTVFPLAAPSGTPQRRVLDPAGLRAPVDRLDCPAQLLPELLGELTRRPFDLTTDLPFRVHLVAVAGAGSVLCLVVHHIVFDGRSAGIVLPELAAIYAGHPVGPPPDPGRTEPPPSPESLRYWSDSLAGLDPGTLPLQRARPEPPRPTFAGARLSRDLAAPSRLALDTLRTRLRATDNMVLLAAYLLLLARHGAGPDLVVAVPVDTRGRDSTGDVGFHVNTIPLRAAVDPRAGFRDLVARVRTGLVAGLAHADVSFESLLGGAGLTTMSWRAPLFRHMFNFLPASTVVPAGPLPDAEWITVDAGLSRYDLQFVVLRWPDRVELQAVYSTEIHDEPYVVALVDRFEALLRAAAAAPDRAVAELDLWSAGDRAVVARTNRGGADDGGFPRPVPHLIAGRVRRTGGACALVESSGRIHGLRELAERAAAVRRHCRHAGVGPGDVVAVAVPRGPDLAAAVLGIWSLGAAYLPVDPAQPAARLQARLDTARVRLVLDRAVAGGPHTDVEELLDGLDRIGPDDLAYVIFTSGSTGEPKGVEITHGGLANVVDFFARHLEVTVRDRVLWLTSFGFDISALELFVALAHGGGAVIAGDDSSVRPELLLDLVTRHDVAIVQSTPTIWRLVTGSLGTELEGRRVLCGGEPLSAALAERLLRSGCQLFNVYGPTETTIWSTVAEIRPGASDPVGVGVPVARTVLDVVDADGRPVPPGIVGELWIGGAGVARGYAGRQDLTAERFRDDPVLGRHYRTGDLATWRPDGTVELIGRADRQVKLRGRRIELGEVETVLERHPAVAAAAVVVHGDPQSDGRLIGYLQARPDAAGADVRAVVARHAAAVLPHYLVPADLVVLAALPRNSAGKVDHRALPAPAAPTQQPAAAGGGDADPLVELWRDLLGRADLDGDSNFFACGGHSLLAAVLAARVGELTGIDVSLHDVFTAPTPRELARILNRPVEATDAA